jgi:hypothetical protein
MIKFGASAVFAGGNREPTDVELDAIIDRTRGATDGTGALEGGKQLDAATMEASGFVSAPVATRSLFGKTLDVPSSEKDIGVEFRKLVQGVRERKSRIKMVSASKV